MAKKRSDAEQTPPPGQPGGELSLVARFARLFQGYSKAHGRFEVRKAVPGEKASGRAWTDRGPATIDKYEQHLSGSGPGLGVIMLRDDDSVRFGVIDYDRKDMDHAKACAAVERLHLPLVLCRSKSGGGHFYCFTSEPVPAVVMRERLAEWTAMLGMAANTEQFPKQASRASDDDIGSWINLPYYDADHTVRYAFRDGVALTLEEFLNYAEARQVGLADLSGSVVEQQNAPESLFFEGPPCLQVLAQRGGFTDMRNLALAATIVYLRKRFPDDWQSRVDEYNFKLCDPPLPSAEVQHIIKTHSKKDYGYQCKQPPINAVCQRALCRRREFGVGSSDPEAMGAKVDINAVTRLDSKHDDPLWAMEVNGRRVLVTNDEFYARDAFNKKVMAQANIVPIHMPPARWLQYLNKLISTADVVALPEEATPTGQLWEWVVEFITTKQHAEDKEGVWLGQVYREGGKAFFRSRDLFKYLDQHKVPYKTKQMVWTLLKENGAEQGNWHLKGKFVNWWSLPVPEGTTEDTPKIRATQPNEDF